MPVSWAFPELFSNWIMSCWLLHFLCHPQAVLFLLFPSDNPLTIHSMSVCNNVIEIWSVVVSAYMLYVLLCSCFFIPLLSFGWRFWRKVMYVPLSLIHKK